MKCRRMEVLLSCYLDGELSEAQSRQVSDHLLECSSCAQEYRTLKKNQMVLSSLSRKEVPAELWPAIQQRVGALPRGAALTRPTVWRSVRRAALLAACLMVAFFFTVVAIGYETPDEAPAAPQVSQRSFMEGHARWIGDDDPLSDKAAWAYVRSHQVIQGVLEDDSSSP